MRAKVTSGVVSVTVRFARWEPTVHGGMRGVFDVYVRDGGRLVWHDGTLSVPAVGEVTQRALRDAVGFVNAYATGDYDGPVVAELAPYAAQLDELSADLDERDDDGPST